MHLVCKVIAVAFGRGFLVLKAIDHILPVQPVLGRFQLAPAPVAAIAVKQVGGIDGRWRRVRKLLRRRKSKGISFCIGISPFLCCWDDKGRFALGGRARLSAAMPDPWRGSRA